MFKDKETTLSNNIPLRYKEIAKLSRTITQMDELTGLEIELGFGVSNYEYLKKQKKPVVNELNRLKELHSILVVSHRLVRFDEGTGKLMFGHRANPNRKKFEWEEIPSFGRGFFLIFSDQKLEKTVKIIDFDNPLEEKFILNNKMRIVSAVSKEPTGRYKKEDLYITIAGELVT